MYTDIQRETKNLLRAGESFNEAFFKLSVNEIEEYIKEPPSGVTLEAIEECVNNFCKVLDYCGNKDLADKIRNR